MWVTVTVSVIVGLIAGRSIVAITTSHRAGLADDWWGPSCAVCGDRLDIGLLRCRVNRHAQPPRTPLIPVATAAVAAGFALAVPTPWVIPAYLVFAAALVALTVTDLDTKLIPNRILLPATVLGAVLLACGSIASSSVDALLRGALAGGAYFAVMLALAFVARGGLGFGDVKLGFLIGLFTGYLGWGSAVVSLVGSFVIGGVVALVLLATKRRGRKDAIPFGPFMTSGAVLAVIVGEEIAAFYLG